MTRDAAVRVAAILALGITLNRCAPGPHSASTAPPQTSGLMALPGWTADRVSAAMPALQRGCARLAVAPADQKLGGDGAVAARAGQAGDWKSVCAAARAVSLGDEAAARGFLQAQFDLVPLTDTARPQGLFTGYYEPEIAGSRERTRLYSVPLRTKPADLVEQGDASGTRQVGRLEDGALVPYYTRAEIDRGALRRQRLDLLYLQSPIDLFFLQIQGSGRIDLPNGHVVRVGFAAGNGQVYVPIGRILSEQGDLAPDQISAESIRGWLEAHPRDARATMDLNPSYTFFREAPDLAPEDGPMGTLGVPLTPMRSMAVDPHLVPLGTPVWIDTTDTGGAKLQRLMVAQDTGSGVTGGLHADIFFGWGANAEQQASRMQAPGRAWMLLPKAASQP